MFPFTFHLGDIDLASNLHGDGRGIERCFREDISGMIRKESRDMVTYMLRFPIDMLLTLAMQVCTPGDFKRYVCPETDATERAHMLHRALLQHVDAPVFLTMPAQVARLEPYSPFILTACVGTDEYVLGVGNVVSALVPQEGEFVLSHPACDPKIVDHVVKVAMRLVLSQPLTWAEIMRVDVPEVDDAFVVGAYRDALHVPSLLEAYYKSLEDARGVVRVFIPRTYFAIQIAHGTSSTLMHNWLTTADTTLVAPMRLLLLARLLCMEAVRSPLPSFARLKEVVTKAVRQDILGESLGVQEYAAFRALMRSMQAIV